MSQKFKNPYFQPPHERSKNLNVYLSAVKNSIIQLCKLPFNNKPNMTNNETIALNNLKSRDDIIIHSADKGGKVVVMNRVDYIQACQIQLDDKQFYQQLKEDCTDDIKELIKDDIENMHQQKYIHDKEYKYLTQDLEKPRTPIFYGLPKIHKIYETIPPMRPIVSGFKSCTAHLSEYLDSFLKYQAQQCKSYVKDTNDFLLKLKSIKIIPTNSIMITMDVASLYTNIDQEEGAEACFEKLETRNNKYVASSLLKRFILLVLRSNIFRFGNRFYRQIKGTAMGTPMAPNYANLFMDKFERGILDDYYAKTGLKPLIWIRYIDDIFFIWTHGADTLQDFINFTQSYSTKKQMKSKIKFEINQSTERVHFLDVTIMLVDGAIATTVYSKPTDSHLYLNVHSCHPEHVIKNIPKSQFLRLRRICSSSFDFMQQCKIYSQYFIRQGYNEHRILEQAKEISLLNRDELLTKKTKPKDQQKTIFVTTWHPKLKQLPSILRQNFHNLENDPRLKEIFPEKPMVAFKRKKTIGNHIVRSDINKKPSSINITTPCKNCKKHVI